MTTEHDWSKDVDGADACRRCSVRKHTTHWQRRKGGHWRLAIREAIPQCTGAEGGMPTDTKALLLKAWMALDGLPANLKQATEAGPTMHNIKSLLAEHGVKVPR